MRLRIATASSERLPTVPTACRWHVRVGSSSMPHAGARSSSPSGYTRTDDGLPVNAHKRGANQKQTGRASHKMADGLLSAHSTRVAPRQQPHPRRTGQDEHELLRGHQVELHHAFDAADGQHGVAAGRQEDTVAGR